MQFIDFRKEHFTRNEKSDNYFIQISKDEIGFGDIEVLKQKDDESYVKADYELIDDVIKVTIKMKNLENIRVTF